MFSLKDISGGEKNEKIYLYDETIKKIEKNYFPFVKIIDAGLQKLIKMTIINIFSQNLHKTLEGEWFRLTLFLIN